MATLDELKALEDEAIAIFKKIKETDPDKFNEIADELREELREMKQKSDVSVNYEEDIELPEKDMMVGFRNY